MKTLAILLLSTQLSLPTNVANTHSQSMTLENIARNYLLYRYSDASFIQMSKLQTLDNNSYRYYVTFYSETTDMDHCSIDLSDTSNTARVTAFACMNHLSKYGFVEKTVMRTPIFNIGN